MKMDWFVLLFSLSIVLLLAAEVFAVWRVRTARPEGGRQVKWDWSWFVYPWICVAAVAWLAYIRWGIPENVLAIME